MEAYEIILNHYYSYISLKNSTAIFHSCQTSFISCSMNIEQPCDITIKKNCDYASKRPKHIKQNIEQSMIFFGTNKSITSGCIK